MDDRLSPVQQKFTETLAGIRVRRLAAHWSPGGRGSASTACSASQKASRFIRCPAARNRFSAKLNIKKGGKKISIPLFLQEEQSARRLWKLTGFL